MTVESLTRRKLQTADGINDTFVYDFLVTDADHLKVYHESDLTTPLSKSSVTGVGNQSGGTVILTSVPPAGTLVLIREVPFTQTYSYTTGGKFPAKTHESLADNVMMAVQQLQDEVGRSVKLPIDTTQSDLIMPSPSAGRTIIGNTGETGWEDGPTVDEVSNAQTYATDANTAKLAAQAAQAAAETAQNGAETAETNAGTEVTYAAEWANKAEDSLVSAAAGGDEVDDYSSLHWANKAAASAIEAAAVVAEVGQSILWNTATPPSGFLEEDGSAISRTTYAALFAVIGTTHGVGDGSTTFNIPDSRGEFIRGWDHGAGNDPDAASRTDRGDGTTGDNIGTKQASENLSHGHSSAGNHRHSMSGSSYGSGTLFGSSSTTGTKYTDYAGTHTHPNSGGNESRPRNAYKMYAIKY